jgi:hypothetical protein
LFWPQNKIGFSLPPTKNALSVRRQAC